MIYPVQLLLFLAIYLPFLLFGIKNLTLLCDDFLVTTELKRQENLLVQCGEIQVLAANLATAAAYLAEHYPSEVDPLALVAPIIIELENKRADMHCIENMELLGHNVFMFAHRPRNPKLHPQWPNHQLRWGFDPEEG